MPANFAPSAIDYLRFLPEIILTLAGTLLMVMDAIAERRGSPLYGNITIGAMVAASSATMVKAQTDRWSNRGFIASLPLVLSSSR